MALDEKVEVERLRPQWPQPQYCYTGRACSLLSDVPATRREYPDNWQDLPDQWLYRRMFVADGNFKADHVRPTKVQR